MNRKMERPVNIREIDPLKQGSTLVVGIDNRGKIVRFNENLEKLTGSSKEEVLDVLFSSYFSRKIPERELIKLINEARFNPESVDLRTSFNTIDGEKVEVSWTGFAVKNEIDGRVSQLNLVGTPQTVMTAAQTNKNSESKKNSVKKTEKKKNSVNKNIEKNNIKKTKKKIPSAVEKNVNEKNKLSNDIKKKQDKKAEEDNKTKKKEEPKDEHKIKIKKKNEKKSKKDTKKKTKESQKEKKKIKNPSTSKTSSKKSGKKKIKIKRKQKKSKPTKDKTDNKDKEVEPNENNESVEKIQLDKDESKKKPAINIKLKPIIKNFKKGRNEESSGLSKLPIFNKLHFQDKEDKKQDESIDGEDVPLLKKKITKLENINNKLIEKNKALKNDLKSAEFNKKEITSFINSRFRFIRDSIGIKRKREEFKEMMVQLSERKKKLEQLETDMVLEKKEFKQKIEEFIKWREKLEKLEAEIEKRREYLSEQETFLNQQYDKVLSHELERPALYTQQKTESDELEQKDETGILEKEDLFNSLTVEAAVLQRGRIKKANKLFAQMLGYTEDELIGKHLVDFVGPAGLSGVEQHYMNRLKGVDDAIYKTIFLSKNDDEIPVKVMVKNGDFQGERAEIATFNEV